MAGFFYATLVNDMGFGEWLRAGGLEITCLMAAGLALYSVMVYPPNIRRFEANIEQLNPPNLLMILTALLATATLAFSLTACNKEPAKDGAKTISSLEQIQKDGRVRIGVFSDKPPFGYVDAQG